MPKGVGKNGRSHRALELCGQQFGKLAVLAFAGVIKQKTTWLCQCECGQKCVVSSNALRTGNTTSCGCFRTHKLKQPRNQVTLACEQCGTAFVVIASRSHQRFCSHSCRLLAIGGAPRLVGPDNPAWRGGRRMHPGGYVLVRHNGAYILEHRLVMEQHLGRALESSEHVHHINHDKIDNRIENLTLTTASDHRYLHPKTAWSKHGHAACVECGGTETRHVTEGLCTRCYDRRRYRKHGRRDRK